MVPSLATSAGLRDVLTSTGFALIIAAAYGTTITSSERRHHTITDTYLDDPNRRQVLIAKVITAGLTGLVFGLAGTIVTTGVGLAFAAGHGHVVMGAGTIIRYGAGAVAGAFAGRRRGSHRSPDPEPGSSDHRGVRLGVRCRADPRRCSSAPSRRTCR